jgi:hypothetical protein
VALFLIERVFWEESLSEFTYAEEREVFFDHEGNVVLSRHYLEIGETVRGMSPLRERRGGPPNRAQSSGPVPPPGLRRVVKAPRTALWASGNPGAGGGSDERGILRSSGEGARRHNPCLLMERHRAMGGRGLHSGEGWHSGEGGEAAVGGRLFLLLQRLV